ncbi:MAG: hypothetical protein U0132_23915 [Gemmatimonadaceae bacterium]
MRIPRDVEVEFEELDQAHGGRQHPLVTNSRPQFYYLGHDWDCRVEIITRLGTSSRIGVRAFLAFLSPVDHVGRLKPGTPFLFREGQRTIGFGTIASILELDASADHQRASPHAQRGIAGRLLQRMQLTPPPCGGAHSFASARDCSGCGAADAGTLARGVGPWWS